MRAVFTLLRDRVLPVLTPDLELLEVDVRRYWKIDEWFAITLRMEPMGDVETSYHRLVALAESGWTTAGTPMDQVWNPEEGSTFIAPEVRWAQLEALPTETLS